MNASRFARVMEVFSRARSLDGTERAVFLARTTADDYALRGEVEALLAHDEKDDSGLLSTSVGGVVLDDAQTPSDLKYSAHALSPESIGGFKILQTLGEGGMGTVYLGEQPPPMRRLVAIKVIRRGLESEEVVARFESEKQALAHLNHQGIAQVYEAGRTPDGRSYFVTEYVAGEPITKFCDQEQLSVEERLELFLLVCQAVQHAHDRGVIHRDLKPSNILISEIHRTPRPKVIDFGVAKAPALSSVTRSETIPGRLVGSLDYMSPEQLEESSLVDARADVYSLGALLYRILVGEVAQASEPNTPFLEFCRVLREDDPSILSARFRRLDANRRDRLAQQRSTVASRLSRRLTGDLDHIVARALEKNPECRYATVRNLSEDIGRHLHHVPVLAKSAGPAYRAWKFVRKNPGVVAAVSAIAVLSTAGTLSSLYLWSDAEANLEESRWGSYVSAVAKADRSLAQERVSDARLQLDNADEKFRDWEWDYLTLKRDVSVATIHSENGPIRSLAWNADRSLLFLGLLNGDIQVRHSHDGSLSHVLTGHSKKVNGMAAAPHDSRLISVSQDGTLRIWDRSSGVFIDKIKLGRRPWAAAWSPDGRWLAVGDWNEKIELWDAVSLTKHDEFWIDLGRATELVFSPDSTRLAAGGSDGISVFDVSGGKPAVLKSTEGWYWSTAWSPDGRYLAGGDSRGFIYVWSAKTHQRLSQVRAHGHWVTSLDFHPDGNRLASASRDGTLAITTIGDDGKFAEDKHTVLAGHEDWVWGARFSPDGRELVSYGEDGTVKTWDTHSAGSSVPLVAGTGRVDTVAFSPDGSRFASGGAASPLTLWDSSTGAPLKRWSDQRFLVRDLVFHPDGRRLVGVTRRNRVLIWNTANADEKPRLFEGHDANAYAIAVFPDERTLVSGAWDCKLVLWNLNTGKPLEEFALELSDDYAVRSVAVTRDGDRDLILSGHRDGKIRTWRRGEPEPVRTLEAHHKGITALALRHDGNVLASASLDRTVKLFDTTTWELTATLEGHDDFVHSLAWSPTGTRLVSGSSDHTVMLWSPHQRGEQVLALFDHTDHVHSVAWSPDGTRIISGALDGTLRVWETSVSRACSLWEASAEQAEFARTTGSR